MEPREARFWSNVSPTGFCWEWSGTVAKNGYGVYSAAVAGTTVAHRTAYLLLVGPIPDGLVLDHLCRNRKCVNPDHLEPVTHAENLRRGRGHGSETHCPQGHEYTEENTRRDKIGRRYCRACRREREARARAEGRRAGRGPLAKSRI